MKSNETRYCIVQNGQVVSWFGSQEKAEQLYNEMTENGNKVELIERSSKTIIPRSKSVTG